MRAVDVSAHTATWIVVFGCSAVVGVALHLGHPLSRRLVASAVNETLAPVLAGRVTIDRVGTLGLTQAGELDAHVDGPDGKSVVRLRGIHATISTWALLRRLFGSKSEVLVNVHDVAVAEAEVSLDADPAGGLRIARAFDLRERRAAQSTGTPTPFRLYLRRVAVAKVLLHAQPTAPVDATIDDLRGSLSVESGVVAVDVTHARVAIEGLAGGARAAGDLQGHLTTPELGAHARWVGAVGGVAESIDASLDHGRVTASIDVARATPEAIRGVWAGSPFAEAVDAHAEVHGIWPHLDLAAHTGVGGGSVDLSGAIDGAAILAWRTMRTPSAHPLGTFHVDARAVDLHALAASAPESSLALTGDVTMEASAGGTLTGRVNATVPAFDLGGARVPAANLSGDVAIPPGGGMPTAHGDLVVREPGMPSALSLRLVPKGNSALLSFEAEVNVPRLDGAPRLGRVASGSAHLQSSGSIDLASRAVRADVTASVEDALLPSASLGIGHGQAHVTGTLTAPVVDVELAGEALGAGPLRLSAIRATGRVTIADGVAVHDVDVAAEGEGVDLHARAALVRVDSRGTRADNVAIQGLGAPVTGSFSRAPGELQVHAESAGIDLARAGKVVGLPIAAGTAKVDVDAIVFAGRADGHVLIDVAHAAAYGVNDAGASLDLRVRGRRAAGKATLTVADVGTLSLKTSSVEIGPGRLVTPSPWRKTWGAIAFQGHLDLSKLLARLPPSLVPLDHLAGMIDVDGKVERDSPDDATPSVESNVVSHGFEIGMRKPGDTWLIDGLDSKLHLAVDGDTGRTIVENEVLEGEETVLRLYAVSDAVPYAQFFSDANPLGAILAMPFEASVDISDQRVEELPSLLRPGGFTGKGQAHIAWKGAALKPTLDVTVKIQQGSAPALLAIPMDLDLRAHYDGLRAEAEVDGASRNAPVLHASAALEASAAELVTRHTTDWTASARARFNGFSLRAIPWLYDRPVRGSVSGEVAIEGLRRDAKAHADLLVDGLQINGVPFKTSRLQLTADGRAIDGSVRIEQSDGSLEAGVHLASRWGNDLVPSIDPGRPGTATLEARAFRAAFFLPLAPTSLTQLDGRIDASVRAEIDPVARIVKPQGQIALREGAFELTTFGTEFHDAAARITLTPDGVVKLDDAVAHGISGTVRAAASARIDAAGLSGARAQIEMPSKDPLPLVFDGVPLGALDGRFDIAVSRQTQGTNVDVDVPEAHVELPTTSSSRDAQALGEIDGVQIGLRAPGQDFMAVSLDHAHDVVPDPEEARKAPLKIAVKLGHDVHVSRGADLDVHLEGGPTVVVSDQTRVSGQIRLPAGGTVEVQGKPFEIESGAVTFSGPDPSNPQVVLTAGWSAPDGTRVYADFIGPLKTAKVTLRSSPVRKPSEILALLLYGSADEADSQVNSDTSNTSLVAAAAGGAATQSLNQALGGVNKALDKLGMTGGITTRVDTSQVNPRPEVEVQIARDISLQIAWVLGVPPPTQPDTTFATLDWRFLRKWSLEATIGDQVTAIVNVVWRHRY